MAVYERGGLGGGPLVLICSDQLVLFFSGTTAGPFDVLLSRTENAFRGGGGLGGGAVRVDLDRWVLALLFITVVIPVTSW